MVQRPFFNKRIEELQALVADSKRNLDALKAIQHELRFRDRPKAKHLKVTVDELIEGLIATPIKTNTESPHLTPTVLVNNESSAAPNRVAIECPNCKTRNFVSTLDGVVQHLACSTCKSIYEAQFSYGVMRTTFQTKPSVSSNRSVLTWIVIGSIVLIISLLIIK